LRTVFLGSAPFATPVLAHLLGSRHVPSLVVTPPDRRSGRGRKLKRSAVATLAEEAGVALLQPESTRSPEFLERLASEEADVFLVVSYGELLREEFLSLPRIVSLNIHPSLLPRHRGATPVQAAILSGDEETGVSLQKVVLELDAGDVLASVRTRVEPGETAGELAERLADLSGPLAVEGLDAIAEDRARWVPQDPDGVTLCRKLDKESGRMDLGRSAEELARHVRAMNPWPMARTRLFEAPGGEGGADGGDHGEGRELAVLRAAAVDGPDGLASATPGEIAAEEGRFLVATGAGWLELFEVQAAGKRALPADVFLRGARLGGGARLG